MSRPRAAAVSVLALLAALLQVSVVAQLPWPGPGEPVLAALTVVGVALAAGARAGALCGFGTGLALDVIPPADHALGQWAFVLCGLGYAGGLLARDVRASLLLTVAIGAVSAALAPLVFTAFGTALGDPRADLTSAAGRLPSIALCTLVLACAVVPLAGRVAAAPGIPLEAAVRIPNPVLR